VFRNPDSRVERTLDDGVLSARCARRCSTPATTPTARTTATGQTHTPAPLRDEALARAGRDPTMTNGM